jgi:hypothetical protein
MFGVLLEVLSPLFTGFALNFVVVVVVVVVVE